MAWFNFIERIIIPTVVLALLAGGIGGIVLGCALVFRSGAAFAFMARMNRWVSTRSASAPVTLTWLVMSQRWLSSSIGVKLK